ncbi:MAG: M20/M25/M40 family metallo-hydrolase, partial [Alphaproteobacteria bacterium]|nr:M20/M25/M40 family metallo-hydrolase [Alphaproteobacteria bacterium]
LGCDVSALRQKKAFIDPKQVAAYFELHIEQGPVLEHEGIPVGVVTGIRGNVRSHKGRCIGAYAHSGAVPQRMRQDAVLATVELASVLEAEWRRIDAEGGDLVLAFGKFFTDTSLHSLSKVPGEISFTIDARSQDTAVIDRMEACIRREAERIAKARGVRFDLEPLARVKPAIMDADFQKRLHAGCRELGIKTMAIPSGAGHDAADFANAGVRTAMIFVRNPNGSHNPAEHMEISDFGLATRLLAWALSQAA